MRMLKCLFFVLISCPFVFAAVDDNTVLPAGDTLVNRQQKIQFAVAKNQDPFITKICVLHTPSIDVPSLDTIPPAAAPGRTVPQSYFMTSDIKIINHCIQKAIFHALQPDHEGTGNPQYATVTKGAPNSVIIRCNLANSGDSLPYFGTIGGFGMNVIPDADHPHGGITDWIQVVVQKKAGGWDLSSAYPIDYN